MTNVLSKQATNLRKEVSLATGVGEATVAHVIAEFNKAKKVTSSKQGQRTPKDFQAEYVNAVHDLVLSANKDGLPLSLQAPVFELSELGFKEIKPVVVISCWKKCLSKARNYWEIVEVGINDESEDEDIDLYSGDENLNKEE
ncbi:2893_t:CDS:2 [Cetraspora pellucida]|uniref:2893_t:CDS:1 n=1 Tax=Cetraspora pellucida TaxID=1433469 RepID=A0A9N9F8N1_9GLOM|nr:2893_t:CDS:2 [Cetraspora pellucida]